MFNTTEKAYAKINLFLEIMGRRPDGYHEIETVMQTVTLADTVTLSGRADGTVVLSCPGLDLPARENLAYRAAKLYLDAAGLSDGVEIAVGKRIPAGAGLAGGSADAAAVLRGLERHYRKLGKEALLELAARLGSDVPFCVEGGCALARGRGEILAPLPRLTDCTVVISAGGDVVSTADAYAATDAQSREPRVNAVAPALRAGDADAVFGAVFNRFGDTAGYARGQIAALTADGARAALLTGSGNAVVGLFTDEETAGRAAQNQRNAGYRAWICAPADREEI